METTLLRIVVQIVLVYLVVVPAKDWWETAQMYQIYPRSFKDSNGDGIGDLNGVTEKLQYLKDIGVTATWLSPIFKSPMVDFGYDISNYTDIQSEYGNLTDFDNLIKKAKEIGIKIILDFVPNHSSNESEWFKKSVDGDAFYRDFYVWHNGIPDPKNASRRVPPNNWLSNFRGSAWEWVDKRKQFYLHQFAIQQPDLNYRNPRVVVAMKEVMRFWLDRGIDGFRVDAVPCLFENATLPDEPLSHLTDDPDNFNYLQHIYTQDQPETIDMLYQWRKVLDDYQKQHGGDTRIMLAETASPVNILMQYYGNSTHEGAHLPFNFNFIYKANNKSDANGIYNTVHAWLGFMPKGRTANWVIGNHDQRRVGNRFGQQRIDAMNMIAMVLPGVSVTYNGEEIGMLDGKVTWKETVDPGACRTNESMYDQFSRDPARTPFQWDNSANAGFSSGPRTWLPVADTYRERNVKVELAATKSHLKVYLALSELRQSNTFKYGNVTYSAVDSDLFMVERELAGNDSYVLLVNINGGNKVVNLTQILETNRTWQYKVASVFSDVKLNDEANSTKLVLKPYEAVVLESKSSAGILSRYGFLLFLCIYVVKVMYNLFL